jgi:cytochrome d ubiquinol oxidase subunit I
VVSAADLTSVRAVVDDFWAMVFNPSTIDRLTHVVLGAWLAGAFLVVSISAYYLLRNRHVEFSKASLKIGLGFATVACVLQMVSADFTARGVLRNQPVKLAALEGVYETAPRTPMTLFGYVDPGTETVVGPKIPGLLSFLCWGSAAKPVVGLRELPSDAFLKLRHPGAAASELPGIRKSYWPNVAAVFQFYHVMIIVGVAMLALSLLACFFWWRGWLFDLSRPLTRWLLVALVLSVLGPQIANQAGWFTAEMGRQPWIVYDMLKISESLSRVVTANQVVASLVLFGLVYALLFVMFIFLLTRKIHHGPDDEDESEEMPESWKALVRTTPRA